jgi:hypothetical protein
MNYYNVGPDLVESSAWWFIGGAVVGLVLGSCGMFLAHRICPELNEQPHTSAWVTTTWDGKVN